MQCDKCGTISYGLLDGYSFGDRVLEGVKFQIIIDHNKVKSVTVCKEAKAYFDTLNAKKWLKDAKACAEETDILECPQCGGDVEGIILPPSTSKPIKLTAYTLQDVMRLITAKGGK